MRWVIVGMLAAALAAAAPAAEGNGGRNSDRCRAERSQTVVRGAAVRVYRTRYTRTRSGRLRRGALRYYGCVRASGRRTFLGPGDPEDFEVVFVGRFRAARLTVANVVSRTVLSSSGPRTPSYTVVIRDLGRRRATRRVDAHERAAEFTDTQGPGVTDLEVAPDGAAGWIVYNEFRATPQWEVYTFRDGVRALVDAGDQIDGGSLRRSGCALTWRNGEAVGTARLC